MNYEIGKITKDIIEILNLDYNEEKTIYIGESNINHIKEKFQRTELVAVAHRKM